MPGAARLGDKARCPMDAHGCKVCSHVVSGPAVQGSSNVIVNGRPAVRKGDSGIHMLCCGSNTWVSAQGAPTVFINGQAAMRNTDSTSHCGGSGKFVQGSGNVIIGNGQGRLFGAAGKTNAPFVRNIAAEQKRYQQIVQQNLEYLVKNGPSEAGASRLSPNIVDTVTSGSTPMAQAQALASAAVDGTPFCAICNAA